MKLTRLADDNAELALRVANALPQYLPAVRDAQQGQPGAQAYGMRHSGGHDTDPTGDAGIARADGDDIAANDEQQIRHHLEQALRHYQRAEQILVSYNSAIVINDRAGIGRCVDCTRYCDGKERRLTNYRATGDMVCDGCRKRRDRAEEVSNVSTHA